jgi:membrane protein DedA with SNARE-associated domain
LYITPGILTTNHQEFAMSLTAWLFETATTTIDTLGYAGVCLLMVMESMVFPVPSEAVMPFAGYLVADGRMTWLGILLASSAGSVIGSLISYAIGYYGGRPFLQRYGKWFLLSTKDLDFTENFFNKHGTWAIFVARFIPLVRHLISVPAGLAKMPLTPFLICTTLGATGWNMFLAWSGFQLQKNWEVVHRYSHPIDMVVAVILLGVGAWFLYAHIKPLLKK